MKDEDNEPKGERCRHADRRSRPDIRTRRIEVNQAAVGNNGKLISRVDGDPRNVPRPPDTEMR